MAGELRIKTGTAESFGWLLVEKNHKGMDYWEDPTGQLWTVPFGTETIVYGVGAGTKNMRYALIRRPAKQ